MSEKQQRIGDIIQELYRPLLNKYSFLTGNLIVDLDYVRSRVEEYPELYSRLNYMLHLALSAL